MFGLAKTRVSCARGCQNHIFNEMRFLSILGFILDVVLESKVHTFEKVCHFWGPLCQIDVENGCVIFGLFFGSCEYHRVSPSITESGGVWSLKNNEIQ